jgi:hypothetical protein
MNGLTLAVMLAIFLMGSCCIVLANPPLIPPVQYEQFCEAQKVSGTGIIDVSTSVIDKKIALEYYNTMAGDGDIELDSEHAYSQNADKLKRSISSVNSGKESGLNLFESMKLTYEAGNAPLVGTKYLNSKSFYGGIGAVVQEMFSVEEMEKDQVSFFASTTPYNPAYRPCDPEGLLEDLKAADRNTYQVEELMQGLDYGTGELTYIPSHLIGIETKNTFNGTWGTDATWHKIFYKDIKAHEMFTGIFEAEKTIKFHENPVPEIMQDPCEGIDC